VTENTFKQLKEEVMALFKKILFPADLSEASLKIVPYLDEMLRKFEAELHIIHVVHVTHYYNQLDMPVDYLGNVEAEISSWAEKKLRGFVEENFKDYKVTTQILRGRPGNEIISYAEKNGVDIIIMGHSSTGLKRAIFGSVAGHAVKYSPVPVMVISPSVLETKSGS